MKLVVMLKNYLKITWRNLVKNKTFSFINITGLSIGLASFLLISLYVLDELSFDRFYKNADRIYRINSDIRFGGTDLHLPFTSDMMGATLKKDYPQVEAYTRIYNSSGSKLVKKGNQYINEFNVAHADSTFFDLFNLPVIAGDIKTALHEPNTVVISESMAKKYFGNTIAVGKTIETNDNNRTLYKVTAVIKDIPRNSHFTFDFIFSIKNVNYRWGDFSSHNFYTYLLLKEGTDYKIFEKNFIEYINKYIIPYVKGFTQVSSIDEFEKAGNKILYTLTPLTRLHLYSDRSLELSAGGNIQFIYIFSAVACFILLIACINFMNLTTARSANRAREVGIRKVLGTERKNLIIQFLCESMLMVLLSLLIAIGIAYLVLPLFNELSAKSLSIQSLFSSVILPLLLVLPFVVGLLAGSYPAFYLSSFKPIQVLKGKLALGKNSSLRSVLVVFQFATSIILIVGTIIIYRQLNYIQTKDLGFSKDQVLIINDTYALSNNIHAFKSDILQIAGVASGTLSGYLPVSSSSRSDNSYSKDAVMDAKNGFNMQSWKVDYDYLKTMGMEIVKGRDFSREFGADSTAVVINEAAANILGYDDPVGKKIFTFDNAQQTISYNIIGVVKNFHFESLKRNIGPLCFLLGSSPWLASFKVNAKHIPAIVKQIEAKWKTMAPGMPFSYRFLDASFDDMYRAEQRTGKIAFIFSMLAIFIACLGLFGLASFIAEQRTKEIGIRKVLGADVNGIIQLLSKDFLKLVLIAFVIAAPAAWYFMHQWLQDFAYRTNLSWWVFLVAGSLSLVISLITVSFQAVKAAVANPVKSLRTE